MRSYKWFILASCVASFVGNAQPTKGEAEAILAAADKNVETYSNIEKSDLQSEQTLKPSTKTSVLKAPRIEAAQFEGDESGIWDALKDASVNEELLSTKRSRYGDEVEAFVLVSLAMPRTSLETLINEIAYQYSNRDINILFRGWDVNDPQVTYKTVASMLPEQSPNVGFDPTVFMKLDITQSPTFVIKTEAGWKKVVGDMSYHNAVEVANGHYAPELARAKKFPISEPNVIEYAHERIREHDWNKDIATATEQIRQGQPARVSLVEAQESYSYYVDPTIELTRDVEIGGQLVAKKGQRINPNLYQTFSKTFLVIDVENPKHIALALMLNEQHSLPIKIIATSMPSEKRLNELEPQLGIISQMDSLIAKRFGVETYPSHITQVGDRMKVDVHAIEEHFNE